MFEQPSSLPRIKTLHLMLGPEAKVYPGVNVSYLGLFPSGCGWCFSLAWRRLVPCRTVLEGILKVVYHVCLRLGNSSPRAVLLNRMSIFLLNSAAHSSPHVDPHFRLFFFQLLNLPLVHCGGWACVPKDFPHSVVQQLFPEACYPHTHTSLKIAARPSLYSLCFQRHSLLSSAFHSPLVQFSLAYKLFAKLTMASNGKNMYVYISNRCKSGERPALSTLAFPKSVGSSSIKKMVLLI